MEKAFPSANRDIVLAMRGGTFTQRRRRVRALLNETDRLIDSLELLNLRDITTVRPRLREELREVASRIRTLDPAHRAPQLGRKRVQSALDSLLDAQEVVLRALQNDLGRRADSAA